jgi:two-component system phosphate regulon sensor histidine kinase PhoR
MKMRGWGIMGKYFFHYLLIIALIVPPLIFFASRQIKRHYLTSIETNLKHQVELTEELLENLLPFREIREIDEFTKRIGKRIGTRITVIGLDGQVLGDSEKDPKRMENHLTKPEVKQALREGIGKSIRYSTTSKEEMLYIALPAKKNGEITGIVRTSFPLGQISALAWGVNSKIIYLALILTIFVLILSFFSARAFTRPIKEMVLVAEKISKGDFNARVSTKAKDEIRQLSLVLNQMAQELRRLFTDLAVEREELQKILSAMIEGVVILDSQKRIVLANESFKKMCGFSSESIIGKPYWQIIRNVNIDELVDRTFRSNKTETSEVRCQDKVYLGNATLLSRIKEKEVLIVFHDITETKQLERVKADFVANVSHELRTPLTAIKGFVETLEEEADEGQLHFLGIIKKHTYRLINLVSDLLLLSKTENREEKLEVEQVNLKEVIRDVLKIFEDKSKQKNLKFELIAPDPLPLIKADSFLMKQLFINLIDNAVKYTKKGEMKLEIIPQNQKVKIRVSDTGIGIPAEHLSKIFERFYVVDKARSRQLGGTGLGLSIVKHIVLLHNGEISVDSHLGRGTTFTIILPV